jgi:2-keto-4-pentenoate hydratase/2-oxohepta-3-ene-1,7-dioic acid hydratase in catechol pathway
LRYCRFQHNGRVEYGLVESLAGNDGITRVFLKPPDEGGDVEDVPTKAITRLSLAEAKLSVPVQPSKIVCVGRNYRAHAAELGNEVPSEPLLFFKPPSSLVATGDNIRRPRISQRTDFEGELAVVMGRRGYMLSPDDDVRPLILGYTALNDFTARDLQQKDSQWTRGKGYDTFCPVGPLVTNEIDPWTGVDVETRVNGDMRQHGNTRDFIFPLDAVIRYISQIMTLEPGDVIATGTPEGVGPVVAGDVIEITVEGVGTLRNRVVDE